MHKRYCLESEIFLNSVELRLLVGFKFPMLCLNLVELNMFSQCEQRSNDILPMLQRSAEPGTNERTPLNVHILNLQFPHLKECATGSPQVRCCQQRLVYGSSLWTCLFLLREQKGWRTWWNSTKTQILVLWTCSAKAKRCCNVSFKVSVPFLAQCYKMGSLLSTTLKKSKSR